nr:unnamed protein product [Digitaria exilis]
MKVRMVLYNHHVTTCGGTTSVRNCFGIQHIAPYPFLGWYSNMRSKHSPYSGLTELWGKILISPQNIKARKMELIGVSFILIMAACFLVELGSANPPAGEVIQGLFVPRLQGAYAMSDAIALFSALIVPYNLTVFIQATSTFFLIENAFALFLVLLVNVAIVSMTGTICADSQLVDNISICSGLTLKSTSVLLKVSTDENIVQASVVNFNNVEEYYLLQIEYVWEIKFKNIWLGIISFRSKLHSGHQLLWAIHYAGNLQRKGFSGMRKCIICIIAPCFTIVPSLIICSIGGVPHVRQLINISAIILAFVLPFALVPLLKFSSSCTMIGPYKNSTCIVRVTWILSMVIMGVNIYFFCTSFISWIVHGELPRIVNAIISILVFPFMAAYIAALIYLVFKKVTVSPSPSMSVSSETEVEEVRRQDDKADNTIH